MPAVVRAPTGSKVTAACLWLLLLCTVGGRWLCVVVLRNAAPVCLLRPCLPFLCGDKTEVNPPVKLSKLYIHE